MEAEDASAVLRVEDQDLILARALQEQEHAFMLLQSGHYGGGGDPSDGYEYEDEEMGAAAAAAAPPGAAPAHAGGPAGGGGGGAAGVAEGGAAEEEEPLDDEALARRLHGEEQRALYERMLEYSGFRGHQEGVAEELDVDAMSYEDLSALGDVAGVVSRGLAPAAVAALPTASFKRLAAGAGGGGGGGAEAGRGGAGAAAGAAGQDAPAVAAAVSRCTICLVDFEEEDELKVLPCRHAYHAGCLDTWLGVSKACPVCNTEVAATGGSKAQA
ncbi:MAG: hypothetical protein J3K34DRAFT_490183 [Monoraphidium minutum]|nr:MAG: hypothetical protein J3K34DRAFT_490183 [Monoraphidium minutum]